MQRWRSGVHAAITCPCARPRLPSFDLTRSSINMSALSRFAVPFVYGLIFVLGYPSQWLLMHLDPGPLTKNELIAANVALILIWITYTKSVYVDPGKIPTDWAEKELGDEKKIVSERERDAVAKSRKWCRKCDAPKPPRAHHCKECKRYAGDGIVLETLRIVLTRQGAYPRWTTTAPGPQTVYLTLPFLTLSASSSTPPPGFVSLRNF